jgi:hypothetical protein
MQWKYFEHYIRLENVCYYTTACRVCRSVPHIRYMALAVDHRSGRVAWFTIGINRSWSIDADDAAWLQLNFLVTARNRTASIGRPPKLIVPRWRKLRIQLPIGDVPLESRTGAGRRKRTTIELGGRMLLDCEKLLFTIERHKRSTPRSACRTNESRIFDGVGVDDMYCMETSIKSIKAGAIIFYDDWNSSHP